MENQILLTETVQSLADKMKNERIVHFSLGEITMLFSGDRGDMLPVLLSNGTFIGHVLLDTADFLQKLITVRFTDEYLKTTDIALIVPSRYMISFSGFAYSDKDNPTPRLKVRGAIFHRKPRQRPQCIIKTLGCTKVETTKFGNKINKYNITDAEGNCIRTFVEEYDENGEVISVYLKGDS